ncbi:MAG TPA: phosphatase PAP2 family protein [Ilumatobacteraceae bacterium]
MSAVTLQARDVPRWSRPLAVPAIVAGLVVLGIGMVIVRNGSVPAWERKIFHAVNDLPNFLYKPLWPFQQLGNLAVGPVVAIAAALLKRYRLAIAVLVATIAKLALERVVKAMASRQRPGTSIGSNVHLRGDVTAFGESFVSGHAVLIAAIAGLVTLYLPGRWKVVPWVVVAMVMVTRVYVGAHNPLDVVCGAALGLAIAGAINVVAAPPLGDEAE